MHDNIDYVDPERIGITGHSTGGRNVAFTLDAYGRNEHGLDYAGQPDDAGDYETKVSSALILAFFPGHYLLNNMPSGVNVGINFARYDEGATVQVTKVDGYQWPDMTGFPGGEILYQHHYARRVCPAGGRSRRPADRP